VFVILVGMPALCAGLCPPTAKDTAFVLNVIVIVGVVDTAHPAAGRVAVRISANGMVVTLPIGFQIVVGALNVSRVIRVR
jgi:hypothetical protein